MGVLYVISIRGHTVEMKAYKTTPDLVGSVDVRARLIDSGTWSVSCCLGRGFSKKG